MAVGSQMPKGVKQKGKGKVRMTEVAELAGVSVGTVSRALQDSDLISKASKKRILEVAEKLGYSRSPIASGLHGKPTPLIGVIVPALQTSFYAETLQVLSTELEASGYQLMIGHHDHNLDREERLVSAFSGWNPSALIVTGVDHNRATTAMLSAMNCPVIEMWDLDGRPLDTLIGFSNYKVGKAIASYLLSKGHLNLVYVLSPTEGDTRAQSRFLGFRDEVMASKTGKVEIYQAQGRGFDAGRDALINIRKTFPETDGVAFYSDPLAFGALCEANEQGISVPDELAVIGYGDLDIAEYATPSLTTVRPPRKEIGAAVAGYILKRLKNPELDGETMDMGFELVERHSA